MSIDKPINEITLDDILSLVKNEKSEDKQLEYKESLFGNTDADKKEFLADISSFANASGGILIYGIEEKRDENGKPTGIPIDAIGIIISNKDSEQLRIESIIRDGISPRLSQIDFHFIKGFPKGDVLIIKISKSWLSPHMITFKTWNRFYSRTNSGKHILDIDEIRTEIVSSQVYPDKIRNLRIERVANILTEETPIPMASDPKIVMHLIPISSIQENIKVDIIGKLQGDINLFPLYSSGHNERFNFDGRLSYSMIPNTGECHSYLQIFNNGVIEAVTSGLLKEYEGKKIIASIAYEKELMNSLTRFLEIVKTIEMDTPIYLLLTLIGVKDYYLGIDELKFWHLRERHTIEKDILQIPEIIINDYNENSKDILKPAFDSIWQACGFSHSYNYDKDGNWIGH